MPAWPGTAVTNGGRPARQTPPRPEANTDVERTIDLILGADMPPPAETIVWSTRRLRRFITEWAPKIKGAAKELLPTDDPRGVAAEMAADEATYRVNYLGPGDGLESAFTYCRSLASIVRELRGHQQNLWQIASDPRPGIPGSRPTPGADTSRARKSAA
ncbi:DUF6415 family natural product biosynthesis protein [Streptomyces klenkii]|uniref:DUF6415 family natural product biosynthesis protein n=1 Tax=Streptomyces klenkii TaxID=1420899 RepID=UPI00340C3B11